MGLFERIFTRPKVIKANESFQLLNGYTPNFTTWKGCLYESELVRAAIDSRARHVSKLSVSISGSAKPTLKTKLKHAPNEWQTWGQFLYRTSTILDVENNCFIVPVLDKYGDVVGIYPIAPRSWELLRAANDVVFIRFHFENGKSSAIELDKVGILTKFQYKNDLFGDSNTALNSVMELINIQQQGITEGVKNSATFRFMATLSNFISDEDLKNERERFSREQLQSGGGGLLLFKNLYKDIKQIDSKPFVIDEGQLKIINDKVYAYFGVNEDILQNKAYGDKWSAFYEGAIEPLAIQLSDVVTRMLFTDLERSNGALVMFTSNRLQYMSTADKLSVSAQLADRGILNRDEVREIWNLPPLPNGEGQAYIIRGEYYNAADKIDEEGTASNE